MIVFLKDLKGKIVYTCWALGVYFKEIIHQHSYSLVKNMATCDGAIAALLSDKCTCGEVTNQRLVTLVTADEMKQASSKQFTLTCFGKVVEVKNHVN
jgi:hypothetical protein